jgi:hypothetical protein
LRAGGHHSSRFATNRGPAYNAFHKEQAAQDLSFFRKNPTIIPLKRHCPAFSEILHLLKCGRYRMLKKIRMVVCLDNNSIELDFQRLIDLLPNDLSPIVFSDDPITKMYDSLPMILFRFEILLNLYEARELDCWAVAEGSLQTTCGCSSGRCANKLVRILTDRAD